MIKPMPTSLWKTSRLQAKDCLKAKGTWSLSTEYEVLTPPPSSVPRASSTTSLLTSLVKWERPSPCGACISSKLLGGDAHPSPFPGTGRTRFLSPATGLRDCPHPWVGSDVWHYQGTASYSKVIYVQAAQTWVSLVFNAAWQSLSLNWCLNLFIYYCQWRGWIKSPACIPSLCRFCSFFPLLLLLFELSIFLWFHCVSFADLLALSLCSLILIVALGFLVHSPNLSQSTYNWYSNTSHVGGKPHSGETHALPF